MFALHPATRRLAVHTANVVGGGLIAAACLAGRARAWTASGATNTELIDNLVHDGVVRSPEVQTVLKQMDRANYVVNATVAYEDGPQPIGHGVTITAPHMHGHALERLHAHLSRPKARALDVGAGSGYFTVAMALLMGPEGHCFGIDRVKDLIEFAERNVAADQGTTLASRITFEVADGWGGLPAEAPFDVIHVGAAADTLPDALVEQLAPGGRMIVPVGVGVQELVEVDKAADGTITQNNLMGVRYVPLVKAKKEL